MNQFREQKPKSLFKTIGQIALTVVAVPTVSTIFVWAVNLGTLPDKVNQLQTQVNEMNIRLGRIEYVLSIPDSNPHGSPRQSGSMESTNLVSINHPQP